MESPLGRGLIALGKYSYSVYLVHFPVIALLKYQPFAYFFTGALSPAKIALATILTAGLSFALYHLVEMPLRHGLFKKRSSIPVYALVSILIVVTLPVAAWVNQGRFSPKSRIILSGWNDRAEYRCGKTSRILHPFALICVVVETENSPKRYLLVGNSHADSIKSALAGAAVERGATLLMMVENCPLGAGSCAPDSIRTIVRANRVTTVLVHSSPGAVAPEALFALVAMGETDDFNVAFIDPVPVWKQSVMQLLYEAQTKGTALPVQTLSDYQRTNEATLRAVNAISSARFTRYATEEYLCTPNCRIANNEGSPFYFDSNHLTMTGARELMPLLKQIFLR